MDQKRRTQILLASQTTLIILLIYSMFLESQSNAYFRAWLSQNFPLGLVLLNGWIVGLAITELILVTGYWVSKMEAGPTVTERKPKRTAKIEAPTKPWLETRLVSEKRTRLVPLRPIYESVDIQSLIITSLLATQAIALWFITVSNLRITSFTANSFYYYSHLPFTYWWGLAATLALFFASPVHPGRARIGQDMGALSLLVFYLIGTASFTYQDPRFLDTYYHTGSSLDLLNYQGWLTSPNWYVHQFPGAFSFIGQLISVAGIDPFQLMRFYPVGLALVVVFMVYVIVRMHSDQYASIASAVLLGGLWFQLHISPQSLELVLYLGIIFLLLKVIGDGPRRRLWTLVGLASTPIFVASHPETPLAVGLGLIAFLVLSMLQSRSIFQKHAMRMAWLLTFLIESVLFWWGFIATDARDLVQRSILSKALISFSRLPLGISTQTSNVPAVPSYSYGLTILSEQGISVLVWAVGLAYFVLLRKLQPRELFLGGLFLAAVSTIPLAIFGRADVIQRSYLFALFPFIILTAWLIERRTVLNLRGIDFYRLVKVGFLAMMVVFAAVIPLARYGVDPIEYIPSSSLHASSIEAGLTQQHSVLFSHPNEDGWRFYAGIGGAIREPRLEQNNLANQPGGYVKPGTDPTVPGFSLVYTPADASANYVVLTSYWQNLYTLRFGSDSAVYVEARNNYTTIVTQNFDLVYSTGTDQIYANQALG
jgi:uncharacterized integral membrane protein